MGGGGGGGVGLKETTVREFRVYRVSIRLPKGKNSFFKAPTTVAAHLKMAENGLEAGGGVGWAGDLNPKDAGIRECRVREYCPHTVTLYNRAITMGLLYPYCEYYSTVTEWGQYPS